GEHAALLSRDQRTAQGGTARGRNSGRAARRGDRGGRERFQRAGSRGGGAAAGSVAFSSRLPGGDSQAVAPAGRGVFEGPLSAFAEARRRRGGPAPLPDALAERSVAR